MAGTSVANLLTAVRQHLVESSASFWTDQELTDHLNQGAHDLWRAIPDLYKDHFFTLDTTNVSYVANATTLTGVPTDVHRVTLIEPADLSTYPATTFTPMPYNHPDFSSARASVSISPNLRTFYYWVTKEGPPVSAPTIYVAPATDTTFSLAFAYVPTLKTMIYTGSPSSSQIATNPVPGESDQAVIAYAVAFARAKEKPDRLPDAGWLQIYGTEKQSILTALTPRQTQEPEVVEALFEPWAVD